MAFKVKGLRWYIIGLIGLSTVINFIDRSAINIMWPYIYKDFGISDAGSKNALALITTFFLIAYAIGQTVSGKIMDWVGTRLGMVYAILAWSFSIALHGLSRSLFSFNIFRSFLGFSEAGNWPGATKSNAEWFPSKERAIAQGIFGASTAVGSVIAGPFIALIFLSFGWRTTFVSIGSLGLLWVIPWLVINKNTPDRHPWLSTAERRYILEEQPADTVLINLENRHYTWKQLLQFRVTWSILLGRFFIDPVWWLFITWLPTFLKEQFLFDIKQIGAFSWFPYLLAAAGGIAGGTFSSFYIRKGLPSVSARKRAITVGCTLMLLSLGVLSLYLNQLKSSPGLVMLVIGIALFGFQFLISNLQTLPSDYYRGTNIGTIAGMGGTAAVIGTLATTWLVPYLTRTSYQAFFVLACLMVPLAWLSINMIKIKKKQ